MLEQVERDLSTRVPETHDENALAPQALAIRIVVRVDDGPRESFLSRPARDARHTIQTRRHHEIVRSVLASVAREHPPPIRVTHASRHLAPELGMEVERARVVVEVRDD